MRWSANDDHDWAVFTRTLYILCFQTLDDIIRIGTTDKMVMLTKKRALTTCARLMVSLEVNLASRLAIMVLTMVSYHGHVHRIHVTDLGSIPK